MLSRYLWKIRLLAQRLWVRAALISGLAIVAALLSPLTNVLPFSIQAKIDRSTLENLLDIITNSMLTVATFSLSIMVTAHLAADSSATPRAYRLLQQDSRTQTVIATFLGAFIYALTLTIMVNTGVLKEGELAIVYFVTVAVIGLVVIAILRWVGHLDGLGSVEATMRRAEERAKTSISELNAYPFMGGRPQVDKIPGAAEPLMSQETGYIQSVDTGRLSETLAKHAGTIHLSVRPGAWIARGEVLGHVVGTPLDDALSALLHANFSIEDRREHGQDTIYSLLLLTEIGERALSPGINDPRTGVYAISRLTRLILQIMPAREMDEPVAPRVHVPPMDITEIIATTLDPIARDGRTFFEIGHSIQTAARDLSRHPDPAAAEAARALSARGLAYARDGVLLIQDLERIARTAIADGPSAINAERPRDSVVEALGEEDTASFFRKDT